MAALFRWVAFLALCITVPVLLIETPTLLNQQVSATVFVQVSDQQDTYILSFNSNFPDPNVIASSKTLPNNVRPGTMWVSSDGRWLFATGIPNGHNYFPLAYTRVGQPFTKPQLYDYRAVLSADDSWLFYNSIDSSGLRETYDFLDLESGRLIELIGAPLANLGTMEGMQEYIVPVYDWMPSDQTLIFIHYQGAFADGLYQIDLTGIDFTKSGQYPMPQATQLLSFDRDAGGATFSPSRKYILYFQANDKGQDVNYTDSRTVKILNRETGDIQIIRSGDGEIIRRVQWRANDTLLYQTHEDSERLFQFFDYDPIRRRSQTIPLTLAGNVSAYSSSDAVICGNTLFYTADDPLHVFSTALYSASLSTPANNRLLYTADTININSCTTSTNWSPARVGTCVPFCTPAPNPAVGQDFDVKSADLNGGDPANGQILFNQSFPCEGCHQNKAVAPSMSGVYTRVINERLNDPLNAGKTAEQYLAESILDPNAYVVPAYYADIHPKDFGQRLSFGDLRDLIAYLKTLP